MLKTLIQTLKSFPKTRSRLTAFLLLCVICTVSMGAVNDIAVKEITIRDVNVFENADNSIVVKTRQTTVGQLLSENNITVGEYDNINFLSDEELSDDSTIIIRRGVPFSVATVEGVTQASTTKSTVGEALTEAGLALGERDEVTPSADTAITAGMTVTVSRVTVSEIVEEKNIPYTTRKEKTDSMYKGETKTLERGENGVKSVTYKITQKDGVEIAREVVSETVIKAPKEEVVQVGTKQKATAVAAATGLPSRGTLRYKASYKMKATAYDPSPSANGGSSRTATGGVPKYGVVAVDPKVIPLGSRLYIESADGGKSWVYGYAIAGDTGGAIKGNRIDLCYNTKSEAYKFGVKQANVYVLE